MAEQSTAVAVQQRRLATMKDRAREIVNDQRAVLAVQGIDPRVFAAALGNAIIANPGLSSCDPASVFAGVRAAIRDGICPDGREGALVPKRDGTCLYLPMKEGLARAFCQATRAAHRCGSVHENDEIVEIDIGINPVIKVKPCVVGKRGELLLAWSYIKMPDGEEYVRIFNKDDVENARSQSRARSGPWVTWYQRMAEKAVSKSHFNSLKHLIPRNMVALEQGIGEVGVEHMLSADPEFEEETVIDGTAERVEDATVKAEDVEAQTVETRAAADAAPARRRERRRPAAKPEPAARAAPADTSEGGDDFGDFNLPDPAS